MVPALKAPGLKLSTPKMPGATTPAPGLPKITPAGAGGFKMGKVPAPKPLPGGQAPASKKDPTKIAEQLKNPRPGAVKVDVLKFEDNGQWSLEKADAVPGVTRPDSPFAAAQQATRQNALATPIHPSQGFNTHNEEQKGLINGITLHNTVPVGGGKQGASWATSVNHPVTSIVKNSANHEHAEVRGHRRRLPNGTTFNSARREVLYHDLAKQFFGLGDYVPLTAGFTVDGEDWSAQKKVNGAGHLQYDTIKNGQIVPFDPETAQSGDPLYIRNPHHADALMALNNSGELDKLTIMDHLLGHHDRHAGNMMVDNSENKIHLIDNGTAFDYGMEDSHPDPRYRTIVQEAKPHPGDHDSAQGFHPEAVNWFKQLKPDQALQILHQHGHNPSSPAWKGFMARYNHLQQALGQPPGWRKPANDVLTEGKHISYQRPKEYV